MIVENKSYLFVYVQTFIVLSDLKYDALKQYIKYLIATYISYKHSFFWIRQATNYFGFQLLIMIVTYFAQICFANRISVYVALRKGFVCVKVYILSQSLLFILVLDLLGQVI